MDMPLAPAPVIPLNERPIKNTIVLFDVDDTLTLPRRPVSKEMLHLLSVLRRKVAIGYVGGSDLSKQQEQLGTPSGTNVANLFDFCFPENGLTAFRLGVSLSTQSFIGWLGEEKYQRLVKWVLRYIADLDIPVMRGTFVEFRNGMINISPIGRNASLEERIAFNEYDAKAGVRKEMVRRMREEFKDLGLTFSIGGQLSFDVFPAGWDKTYCLRHVEAEAERADGVKYETIHFFGDKIFDGGNDWEIAQDARTTEHPVKNPDDTMKQIIDLFDLA